MGYAAMKTKENRQTKKKTWRRQEMREGEGVEALRYQLSDDMPGTLT